MASSNLDRDQILENGWGLGRCFTADSAPTLFSKISECHQLQSAIYIAVTHDCSVVDPRLDVEPFLEYFVARPVETTDGMLVYARNIRKLHIPILVDENEQFYELSMGLRGFVSRESLGECSTEIRIELPVESKNTLIRWIANRYTTQTFPDEFNRRIQPLIGSKKAPLKRLLETSTGEVCASIYLRLTPDSIDLDATETYGLEVLLLFRDEDAKRIGYPLMEKFGQDMTTCLMQAENISPLQIHAMSEKDAVYHDVVKMQRWQLDYISLREPEQAVVSKIEQS